MRISKESRRAVVAVESAIVLPILLTVVLGIIVGSFAVFIYQETAALAREGARYASVHGAYYTESTAKPPTPDSEIYDNAIAPYMVGMDPANLSYSVTWTPNRRPGSYVSVTVTYNLSVPLLGNLTLTSTSTEEVHW